MSNLRHVKAKNSHLRYTLGRQVKNKKVGSKRGVGSKTTSVAHSRYFAVIVFKGFFPTFIFHPNLIHSA